MLEYNHIAGQKVQRIEALSDGVFAIAMTLLVIDLKEPADQIIHSNADLWHALGEMSPKFLSYFMSFMTLGIFWTGQSTQFSFIEKYNRDLNWYTLFFLLFVSLLPFTTAVLSGNIERELAVGLYWLNIAGLGLLLLRHWTCAARLGYLNLPGGVKNEAIRRRIIVAQSLYAGGALLCFVNTYLSIFIIIAIQLNYAFALLGKRAGK
jgi:uncharacterized membrane protein